MSGGTLQTVGAILIAIGGGLGLFASGYVLYGPGFPAGTTLPAAPSPAVLIGFWAGLLAFVAGLVAMILGSRMREKTRMLSKEQLKARITRQHDS